MPALSLMLLALGLATLPGAAAATIAGAIFVGALSVKLTAVTVLPALLVVLGGRRMKYGFAGAAATTLLLLAAHASALTSLWADGVTYHSKARSTPTVIPHPHQQIFDQIPHGTPFFVLVIIAIVTGVVFTLLRRPLGVWPLWTWVALGVVFLLLHAPLHYNHLILFPFALAVASGSTIGAAVRRAPRAAIPAASAALILSLVAGWIQQLHRVDTARVAEPSSTVAAARALARLSAPNATTVDDRPIISFLAHRRVNGALVDIALLRFETGSLTDSKVIRELQAARAVVVSRVLARRPGVMRYLATHFELRYNLGGVRIYTKP
jgi:hypothetical protein